MVKFSFPAGCVAVAGSRTLPPAYIPLVASIAQHIARSSGGLSVGCCLGVDQAVISSVEPKFLHIHTIFNARGEGACSLSTVQSVLSSASAGSRLTWLSGGDLSKPLNFRLSSRTKAVVSSASSGLLAFFISGASRGTSLACKTAASQGLPVLAIVSDPAFLPTIKGFSWSKTKPNFSTKNLLAFHLESINYHLFR